VNIRAKRIASAKSIYAKNFLSYDHCIVVCTKSPYKEQKGKTKKKKLQKCITYNNQNR
jgi:hypothetical protein